MLHRPQIIDYWGLRKTHWRSYHRIPHLEISLHLLEILSDLFLYELQYRDWLQNI